MPLDTAPNTPALQSQAAIQTAQEVGRRFFERFSALAALTILAQGIFFATQILVANRLGKLQFGYVAYGIALGNYGAVLVRYGMDRTMVRDLIHHPELASDTIAASYLLRSIITCALLVAIIGLGASNLDAHFTAGAALVFLAWSIKSLDLESVYDAWMQMNRHAVYNILQRLLCSVLIIGLIFGRRHNLHVLDVAVAYLLSTCFYLFLQHRWVYTRHHISTSLRTTWAQSKRILRGNVPIVMAGLIGISFTSFTQIALKSLRGPTDLGIFAASWQFGIGSIILLNSIVRIGNPAIASVTRPGVSFQIARKTLFRYMAAVVLLMTAIGAGIAVLAPQILSLFFAPEYAAALPSVRILSLFGVVHGLTSVTSQYVLALHLDRKYFVAVLSGAVASVALAYLLIPGHGSAGTAWSIVGSQVVCAGVLLYHTVRYWPGRRLTSSSYAAVEPTQGLEHMRGEWL